MFVLPQERIEYSKTFKGKYFLIFWVTFLYLLCLENFHGKYIFFNCQGLDNCSSYGREKIGFGWGCELSSKSNCINRACHYLSHIWASSPLLFGSMKREVAFFFCQKLLVSLGCEIHEVTIEVSCFTPYSFIVLMSTWLYVTQLQPSAQNRNHLSF